MINVSGIVLNSPPKILAVSIEKSHFSCTSADFFSKQEKVESFFAGADFLCARITADDPNGNQTIFLDSNYTFISSWKTSSFRSPLAAKGNVWGIHRFSRFLDCNSLEIKPLMTPNDSAFCIELFSDSNNGFASAGFNLKDFPGMYSMAFFVQDSNRGKNPAFRGLRNFFNIEPTLGVSFNNMACSFKASGTAISELFCGSSPNVLRHLGNISQNIYASFESLPSDANSTIDANRFFARVGETNAEDFNTAGLKNFSRDGNLLIAENWLPGDSEKGIPSDLNIHFYLDSNNLKPGRYSGGRIVFSVYPS